MSELKSYVLMLKSGAIEDRFIRGISPEGGEELKKQLQNDPPMFIEIKGILIARSDIAKLIPIYGE